MIVRACALPARSPVRFVPLAPAPVLEAYNPQDLWRDFGVHPVAMLRRVTVDRPLAPGAALPAGFPAHPLCLDAFRQELEGRIEALRGQPDFVARLATGLQTLARSYGVEICRRCGPPTVNWSTFPKLDVIGAGGDPLAHEMVHAVQCTVGGVAALGTVAAEKFRLLHGREPNLSELKSTLAGLSDREKQRAYTELVQPMECQAYSRFEQGAFYAGGMFGRKSRRDPEGYAERVVENLRAFCQAYRTATVPALNTGVDARLYGAIGHVARTHGETALLLGVSGTAYYGLVRTASNLHPALALVGMAPLGYLLYRCIQG